MTPDDIAQLIDIERRRTVCIAAADTFLGSEFPSLYPIEDHSSKAAEVGTPYTESPFQSKNCPALNKGGADLDSANGAEFLDELRTKKNVLAVVSRLNCGFDMMISPQVVEQFYDKIKNQGQEQPKYTVDWLDNCLSTTPEYSKFEHKRFTGACLSKIIPSMERSDDTVTSIIQFDAHSFNLTYHPRRNYYLYDGVAPPRFGVGIIASTLSSFQEVVEKISLALGNLEPVDILFRTVDAIVVRKKKEVTKPVNSSTNECDVLYITAPRTDGKTEGAFRINSKQLADLKIGLSSDVIENLQCYLSGNKIAKTETGIEGEKTFFFQRSTIIALSIAFHTLGIDFQKNCVIISHEALVADQENIFETVKRLDPRLILPASWETAKICYGAVDQFEQVNLRSVIYPGKKFSNVLENQEQIISRIFENAKHDDAVRACKVGEKCLVCDACRSKENNVDLVNSHFHYRTVTQSLKTGYTERGKKRSGLGCIEVAHAISKSNQEQGGKENDVTTFVKGTTFHYSSGKPLKGTIHCKAKLFDDATYVLKILGGNSKSAGIPGITNGGGNYLHTIDWHLRYPTGTSEASDQQKQRGGYFEFQSVGIWPITPDSINQIKTNEEREALELLGAMLVNVIQSLREKDEISPRELGKMKDDVSKRRKNLGITDN